MVKKCKKNKHNWTPWELRWDKKNKQIWERCCLECETTEKSKYAPPVNKKEVSKW